MMKRILAIYFTIFCAGAAYSNNYGPFPPDAKIELIKLTELERLPVKDDKDVPPQYTYPIPNIEKSKIVVTRQKSVWMAELIINGQTVLPPSPFSDFDFSSSIEAMMGDLNNDGTPDYIIYSYSSGCGLAAGYCNIAFVLSKKDRYTLTTVLSLWPGEDNYIFLGGKPHFIHTSFHYVNKCKDGKNHNFWLYNLMAFQGDKVNLVNDSHPEFPKIIWFTFKPNHSETTIITEKQKQILRENSLREIYWKMPD
jgi:hypothetical protein